MDLKDAFSQIQQDRQLARRFTEEPETVLKDMGIDTSSLVIRSIPSGNAPFDAFSNSFQAAASDPSAAFGDTICASVGCVACVSVG